MNTTADIIHDTDERISKLQYIRQDSVNTPPFEVGYLTYILQEKYRKMVDKFNTSTYMKQRLYLMELVLILEEIERHYWQVEHISNMMHEIERKYKIKTNLHEKYDDDSHGPPTHYHGDPTVHSTPKPKRFKMNKYLENRMTIGTTKKRPKWWDLEYGWDIDYYW
ncbi:uncharacterized protein LOC115451454 isoform X4 [Manduca sexta]|nr:uncharacterized protein LOC115451454 isoform X4 [Manduca sexta]